MQILRLNLVPQKSSSPSHICMSSVLFSCRSHENIAVFASHNFVDGVRASDDLEQTNSVESRCHLELVLQQGIVARVEDVPVNLLLLESGRVLLQPHHFQQGYNLEEEKKTARSNLLKILSMSKDSNLHKNNFNVQGLCTSTSLEQRHQSKLIEITSNPNVITTYCKYIDRKDIKFYVLKNRREEAQEKGANTTLISTGLIIFIHVIIAAREIVN